MSNSKNSSQKITLDDIALRKEETLEKIRGQKAAMSEITHRIFAPLAPAATGASSLMRTFNTGMAIFDGVMLGMKLMRKVRAMFRK